MVLDANETLVEQKVIKDGVITVPVATQANYNALAGINLNINAIAKVVQGKGFYNSNDMAINAAAACASLNP